MTNQRENRILFNFMVLDPLLHHYALQRNVDKCERLYGKYLEASGKLTIDMHGYLLEVYRCYRRSKHV